MRLPRHAAACTFMLIGAYALEPSVATAQSLAFAGGVAIPRGPMADRRAVGQQISLAISPSYRVRGRTVRGELTQSWFPRTASYAATRPG